MRFVTIDINNEGQRVDNYILSKMKGVPKTRLYRAIRKGEVRVNKKRIKADYRLQVGDIVRLPPLRVSQVGDKPKHPPQQLLRAVEQSIIYQSKNAMVLNKPSGVAVHGGSGVNFGVIEILRYLYPKLSALELVHRLDRETSGCLVVAKKRSILKECHHLLTERKVEKIYLALLAGDIKQQSLDIKVPLTKNNLQAGQRVVRVDADGKSARTQFKPIARFGEATLVSVKLHTGRMHQIRVHAAHMGHPVAGDSKYGDRQFNTKMQQLGLKRLFLHASSVNMQLTEAADELIAICAPLDNDLKTFLKRIEN